MYIDELDCDWMSHPFLRSSFKLGNDAQLAKIVEAGIHYVYIDTERGLDLPDAPTHEEVQQALHEEMIELVSREPVPQVRISLAQEIKRAAEIRGNAQQLVQNVMRDVRLGRAVELERVEPMVTQVTESILRNGGALIGLLKIILQAVR